MGNVERYTVRARHGACLIHKVGDDFSSIATNPYKEPTAGRIYSVQFSRRAAFIAEHSAPHIGESMANTYDLAAKFAVVTGAARGIGRTIAELLLDSGCHVTIWDKSPADVRGATSVLVDITQPDQIVAAVA